MVNESAVLLTFEEAAARLHPAIKSSTLHLARRNGRLWAKKVGNRYFTSHTAVMDYLKCPDPESPPASISAKMNGNGSSGTGTHSDGQAVIAASVKMLKELSPNISPTAVSRSDPARPGQPGGTDRGRGAGPLCRG